MAGSKMISAGATCACAARRAAVFGHQAVNPARRNLETPEDIAAYLTEAFATDDPAYITQAVGTAARAKGMSAVAKATGLGRENLYRALGVDGNPGFATVMRVLRSLGIQLTATANPDQKAA